MSRVALALEKAARLQRPAEQQGGVFKRTWSLDLLRYRHFEAWSGQAHSMFREQTEPAENLRTAVLEQFPPRARRLAR